MIQINLIPDVKREYLRAKKARTVVITSAVMVGIVSVGLVVLLSFFVYGGQAYLSTQAGKDIEKYEDKLQQVPDLENMLTIQNQLKQIDTLHDKQNVTSRLFDLLLAINPVSPNNVSYSAVKFDTEGTGIHIEAQAKGGFVAADVFKKTLEATKFRYIQDGETVSNSIANQVSLSNLTYGKDANGADVLGFSIDVTVDPAFFAVVSDSVAVVRPDKKNATDSFQHIPESLFNSGSSSTGGKK